MFASRLSLGEWRGCGQPPHGGASCEHLHYTLHCTVQCCSVIVYSVKCTLLYSTERCAVYSCEAGRYGGAALPQGWTGDWLSHGAGR